MNDSQSPIRPRPWRLQFSLKLLLIAFTAFAIGFPIWYRWPYEETDIDPTGTARWITTWQRQFGGGRRKQGLERLIANGQTIESTMYRNGVRHGSYENQGTRGQYESGLKEGIWTDRTRTSTWHRGKLDGPMVLALPPLRPPYIRGKPRPDPVSKEPRKLELMFSAGRLTHMDGKLVTDARGNSPANRLFELQGAGVMDPMVEAELGKLTTVDVVEMPLKDVVLYLAAVHNMHFILDHKLGPKFDLPITGEYRGCDLYTVLLLLTAPNGLACDYRYGCVWITSAEDGYDWREPTGVAEIKPPKDTALARAWNEISPPVDTVQTPLTEVLAYMKQPLAIEIDTSQIEEATEVTSPPLVTAGLRGLKFCDTLGQLLYRTGCRCRLEGEKLVVLPPLENQKDAAESPVALPPRRAGTAPRAVPAPSPSTADPFAP
jgi:hypothetical protein